MAEKTNNLIRDLLPDGVITSATRLVLVNAVYFSADWTNQFDVTMTRVDDFYLSSNTKVKVSMMQLNNKKFWHGFNRALNSNAVVLPYVNNTFSMIIVLPKLIKGLSTLESSLAADNLVNILATGRNFKMIYSKIDVRIPKFELDLSLSLSDDLTLLGMSDLFDANADLSGIDGARDLSVTSVQHNAFIRVDEQGSQAAAATGVGIGITAVEMPTIFAANHPFLFFIRDNSVNSIVFFGRFTNPSNTITQS